MSPPADRSYHPEHTWARPVEGGYEIGITGFAQGQLGEIVYLELPPTGARLEQGQAMVLIESVKVTNDLVAPLPGVVVELNGQASTTPPGSTRTPTPRAGW